jgi:hypothetical protein
MAFRQFVGAGTGGLLPLSPCVGPLLDPALTFPDFTGRPRPILDDREPIVELL